MDGGAWLTPFGRNPRVSSDEVKAAILRVLPSGYGLKITELESLMSTRYHRNAVKYALDLLVGEGLVEKTGSRGGTRYKRYRRQVYDPGPFPLNRIYARRCQHD